MKEKFKFHKLPLVVLLDMITIDNNIRRNV